MAKTTVLVKFPGQALCYMKVPTDRIEEIYESIAGLQSAEVDMKILIGPENISKALLDTSVVVASYDIGDNMRGLIGVVGPTRMDYASVTARLSYFAEGMARMFGKKDLPSKKEDQKT